MSAVDTTDLTCDSVYIDGKWLQPQGIQRIELVNAHSEARQGSVAAGDATEIRAAIAAARRAFDTGPWPKMTARERGGYLNRLATMVHARWDQLANLMVREISTPYWFAHGPQVDHPVRILRWYADHTHSERLPQLRRGQDGGGYLAEAAALVEHVPVGVVAIVTPWNMPLKTVVMKLAPALATGCTVVIKPSELSPMTALVLAELCEQAEIPAGVVNVVPTTRDDAWRIASAPGIDKIAFTGSSTTGRSIAREAAGYLRRTSLELGGKSATIICQDADPTQAADRLLSASMLNSGQICSNQTRVLVHRDRHDEVVDAYTKAMNMLKVGDPADPVTDIGPLVSASQQRNVQAHVAGAIEDRGNPIGSNHIPGTGWYVHPTVFTGLPWNSLLVHHEVFGPILTIHTFIDDDHAVSLANDSMYGLDAGVWSADTGRALDIARRLRVGNATVNGAPLPLHTPMGGFKQSGMGRELGPEGLSGYYETRAIGLPPGAF